MTTLRELSTPAPAGKLVASFKPGDLVIGVYGPRKGLRLAVLDGGKAVAVDPCTLTGSGTVCPVTGWPESRFVKVGEQAAPVGKPLTDFEPGTVVKCVSDPTGGPSWAGKIFLTTDEKDRVIELPSGTLCTHMGEGVVTRMTFVPVDVEMKN